ncbi:2f6eac67-2ef2-47ac-9c2e-d98cdd569134 [Sclerotinia trifoliorum]|uniref:2f6eac67-2ef2-47ac-9c2e-d98cdd569134 n=1 Tax=Sclerotinia trifoliorum TaxID=28548 RepID=A0A8H2VWU0_9HELO|nr:2f6eac67-2ef2-47ac-9c2e-d98cdd569134 [Sclerotinia trifoliorum]
MVNIILSPTLSTGMSPSSSTSNFCGLPRPSISHSHSKSHDPISDASSTTSSKFRKQLVANARPLLLRRRDTTNTTHSIPSINTKSKLSTSTSSSTSYEDHANNYHHTSSSSSSTSHIPPSRNLKLKKSQPPYTNSPSFSLRLNNSNNPKRESTEFQWAREDQLSVILEYLDETRSISSHTTNPDTADPTSIPKTPPLAIPETIREILSPTPTSTSSPRTPRFDKIGVRERASNSKLPSYSSYSRNTGTAETPGNNTGISTTTSTSTPEPTKPPNLIRRSEQTTSDLEENSRDIRGNLAPQEQIDYTTSALGIRMASSGGSERGTSELESIARIDSSLIFEHFTTSDAWVLGSALRERLLPHPTPVVISISLSNANQILFHCCTHSGTMPDNDSWVSRKRKTVLRWGVSTWYMWCKFEGDEGAFARKYGLGNESGEYAIHGGGVPIRVTGVEGVVACVVVSGLKQWEDHGVIVEVIRDLYY